MMPASHVPTSSSTPISATDLQRKSGEVLRRVYRGETFVVLRDGYPVAEIRPCDPTALPPIHK
jgi:prevent-host-death family protein